MEQRRLAELLREAAPRVLASLTRRYGRFDAAEDAVQEALIAAAEQWPRTGVPDAPRAWLLAVASRRLVDIVRSESARRGREERVFLEQTPTTVSDTDDTLALFFLCCHPSLSAPSQLALTLRAVGGLTTAEIAAAFLVPEATMAQRISRAKQTVRAAGARFELPAPAERGERLAVVLQVLYLVFNEGYAASSGAALQRRDLALEAIRITRLLREAAPRDPEVAGLLALELLTDARRDARTDADGIPVALEDQDRSLWHGDQIDEGLRLVREGLASGEAGPYLLQAAIAAAHDEAPDDARTDWRRIVALYDVLLRISPGPVARLGRAIAISRVDGPRAGLALLDGLAGELGGSHRLDAARARLLELDGRIADSIAAYRAAAAKAGADAERRWLERKAEQLAT